jgi:tetratricopeptide (TPR) repeat protein
MFGRDRETAELIGLIAEGHPMITVVGPPGVGKKALIARVQAQADAAQVVLQASRKPFGVHGERIFRLRPLAEFDAVQLFQARAAEKGRTCGPDDEAYVRAIVRRLDRLPRLLEWAADLTGLLSLKELRRKLDRSLVELFEGLDALMRPSWKSLGERARTVLSQLSVFPGSFTLDACEAILGEPHLHEPLSELIEASLLHREEERLALYAPARGPMFGPLARKHAEHYLGHLERRCDRNTCLQDASAVDLLQAEQDNLLAIHGRFVGSDPPLAARAALLLDALFSIRGPFDRHLEILDASIASASTPELLRARGEALRTRRRLTEARADLEAALAQADLELAILCRQELGILAREEGDLEKGRALLERALADAPRWAAGILLGNLGTLHRYAGELELAADRYRDALAVHRQIGNRRSEMIVLGNLGHLFVLREELDQAKESYRAALSILEDLSDPRSEAIILAHLGAIDAWRGDSRSAEWMFERALALVTALDDRPMKSLCLAELGALHLDPARFAEARRALAGLDAPGWGQTIAILEGFLDLDRAQVRLDAVLDDVRSAHTEFLRLAVARLSDRLRSRERLSPSSESWKASRDGAWFETKGARTDLENRVPLKRIFARLIDARRSAPNTTVSLAEIIRAGWPGEDLIPHSATTRAYVAISTLRRLGLKDVLVSRDGGYLLLGSVPLDFSDP